MDHLSRTDLMSLEQYAESRAEFRGAVLNHKESRRVQVGPNATLYFEDRMTIQYQVQEMLRIERIFDAEGIEEELAAYNPLIPDGGNWKATFMIEFPDAEERRVALTRLVGIEDAVWIEVDGCPKVFAVADEDLERATEDKTSAVHFLRFELPAEFISSLKGGSGLNIGIDHENYSYSVAPVADRVRASLIADLD